MSNMAEIPREKLKEIIARNGDALLQDPDRCEGLLKDHCGPHRREISALVGALEERVPLELKSSWQSAMTPEAMRARLVQRLQDHRGLAPDVADWAVDAWSYALGVGLGRRSDRLASEVISGAVPAVPPAIPRLPSQPHPADAAWAREFGDAELAATPALQPQSQPQVPPPTPVPVQAAGWSTQKKAGAAVAAAVVAYLLIHYVPTGGSKQVQACSDGQTRAATGECVSPPPPPGPRPPEPKPAEPKPLEPKPAEPKPPEPSKASAAIAVGTSIPVSVDEALNSDTLTIGQYVKGTVNSAVLVDGKVAVPAGTTVVLQVKGIDQAGKLTGSAKIDLALVEMNISGNKYPVASGETVVKGPSKTANTAKKTGIFGAIGTGIGCGVGHVTGHTGAGCGAGAGGGAATGVAVSAHDKPKPAVLKSGTILKFKLVQPVNIA
jgi:hypothetical protein